MSERAKKRIKYIPIFLLLLIFALLVLVPVVWMALSAFKDPKEIIKYPPTFFPVKFSTANFTRLYTRLRIMDYVKNSIIYALVQPSRRCSCALSQGMPLPGLSLRAVMCCSFWCLQP